MLTSTHRQKGTTRQAVNRVSLAQKAAANSLIKHYPSSPHKALRAGWKKQRERSARSAIRKQGGIEVENGIQREISNQASR